MGEAVPLGTVVLRGEGVILLFQKPVIQVSQAKYHEMPYLAAACLYWAGLETVYSKKNRRAQISDTQWKTENIDLTK